MATGQGWRFITKFPLIALPPSLLLYTQWTYPVLMASGPDSTTQREHVQTHGSSGGGENVPGEKKTTGTAVLESGASVLQSFKPINQVATISTGFPAEFLSCMSEVVSGRWEPLGCACGQSSTFCCFRSSYEVLSRLSAGVACGVGSDAPDFKLGFYLLEMDVPITPYMACLRAVVHPFSCRSTSMCVPGPCSTTSPAAQSRPTTMWRP
jgi:hypothetical protein